MNTQDRSPLGLTGWNFLQSKGLLRVFSNTTVQKHQFFGAQLSSPSTSHVSTRAGKNWWASCSYRKFPQGGSTFSCPTLVPPATRALGKVGFLGCELEWNVLETQERVSHCFFPLNLHPPPQPDAHLGLCSLLRCLGGSTLRKEASAGDPSATHPGYLVNLSWPSRLEGWATTVGVH